MIARFVVKRVSAVFSNVTAYRAKALPYEPKRCAVFLK